MPPNSPYRFEACIEAASDLSACIGLVDRIELCSGLDMGGLTPSKGLMQAASASGLETHVLIRPRTGGFDYSADDIDTMLGDIETVGTLGLKGVVIGASSEGGLDLKALERMIEAARGMDVTLHRVIDVVGDPLRALDQAIDLGMIRVLTSGGAPKAVDGIAGLAALRDRAAGRIEVMAGSGVNSANLTAIAEQTGVTAFHASCSGTAPLDGRLVDLSFGTARRSLDRVEMSAIRAALDALVE